MKKRILFLLLFGIIISGCYRKGTLGETEFYQAAAIVEAGVPFGFTCDPAFDRVDLIEQDQYGRALYRYTSEYEIYVICQKIDDPYAYYYENDCYLVHSLDSPDFSQNQINELKVRNDWNKPLNHSKMCYANYIDFGTDVPMRQEVQQTLLKYLRLEGQNVTVSLDGLETNAAGSKLIVAFIYDPDHTTEKHQMYFILVRYQNEACHITTCVKADINSDIKPQVIAFKSTYFY